MTGEHDKTIRVGSRKSELALIQTKHVIARLQKLYPNKKFEILIDPNYLEKFVEIVSDQTDTMSTIGDRVLNISLPKIGEKSLFTRDLEDALLNGGVDFVVHSLKDLPTALPIGMAIGAVLEREDPRDALVLRENYDQYSLKSLPKGSVIGTSSLRRTAQIRRKYPHLNVCDIRGNLNTRLAKLDAAESKFAGIILAQAGLVRMGWMSRISEVLEPVDLMYAVGQGALAVECRANDEQILAMLQRLMCLSTTCRILAERSFLKTLGGGCSAPVAVWSNLNGDISDANGNPDSCISLIGAVWSLDGKVEIRDKRMCSLLLKENGGKREIAADDGSSSSSNEEQPPRKRMRNGDASSSPDQSESDGQSSPPVINDDSDVERLSSTYDINALIAKHIDLAKQCPVVGAADVNLVKHIGNNGTLAARSGDGDAIHCPVPIDVGQDFMGECPFVSNETKVSMAAAGQCPLTKDVGTTNNNTTIAVAETTIITDADQTDHATPSTSKCPFSSLHKQGAGDFNALSSKADTSHGKCPFLQKTVQMFDYADEEKPTPKQVPVLLADVENLFCGLYQHACYNRELYARSNMLGEQLAEELIKNGALDVMKCAQAEIHSKS